MNYDRLVSGLKAAMPNVVGVCGNWGPDRSDPQSTYYSRDEGVIRVMWSVPPTAQQDQQAAAIVAAYDPTPTEVEKLDALRLPPRVIAALLIRASSGWSSLSAARRNRVMQVIDDAAQAAVQQLS